MNQEQSEEAQFKTLIEEVIVVGLNENCRCIENNMEFKWITSLQIVTQNEYELEIQLGHQEHKSFKYVQIGNQLYLKILFCQKDKKPITKIKSSKRLSNPDLYPIPYPNQVVEEEYLCYMVKQMGKIIIEDVQMVQVRQDNELSMDAENSYQIIRLPSPCQNIQKDQYSNSSEHMLSKTRYLLVKTLDIEQKEHNLVQYFEPQVIFQHSMKNKTTLINYNSFHSFCFPEGVILEKKIIGCGYSIFNFILTQEDGTRIYVNCLKFKQKLGEKILETLPANCIDKHIHQHETLYTEKAICLLSKYCYTQFFHNLLEELFRKYQTKQNKYSLRLFPHYLEETEFTPVMLEFIEKYEVGFLQCEKKFNYCEYLKEEIQIQMEWDHRKVVFPLAKDKLSNSYSPKAIHCLFKMLSVEKIVDIVRALLEEKTVIFVSQSQVAVGYAIESLISFLFPLKWEHVILPILPLSLLNLLEAPIPMIAGVPTKFATDDLLMGLKQSVLSLVSQCVIVFLDHNDVLHKDSARQIYLINHFKDTIKRLRIYDIYIKEHVDQMLQYRDQFYLFQIYQRDEAHFSAEHIKHIFFEMILLFLQNYHLYYSKNNKSPTKSPVKQHEPKVSQRKRPFNFKKDYNLQQFIRSHPKNNIKFMRKFTESSLFGHFIYHYYGETENPAKVFIDNALKRQNIQKSDFTIFQNRFSQQPCSTQDIGNLRKKSSWPANVHNMTWSPPPKKLEEMSETNYTRNFERNSTKVEDIELEREKSVNEDRERSSPGSNICEAISRAMKQLSNSKNNLFMWTAARLGRLKKEFNHKQKQHQTEENNKRQSNQSNFKEQDLKQRKEGKMTREEPNEGECRMN